jgi:hypothetical protein
MTARTNTLQVLLNYDLVRESVRLGDGVTLLSLTPRGAGFLQHHKKAPAAHSNIDWRT